MVTIRSSLGMKRRQHVEGRRLAGAGAAGDDDVEASADAGVEEVGGLLRDRAEVDEVVHRQRVGGELADRQRRAVDRERRDDGVDTAAVGKAGVDHRAGLVDAAADAGHDLLDGAPKVGLVGELGLDRLQPTVLLQVDLVEAVDHDLGDVGVTQERLDRPVAEDVVADLLGDPGAVGVADRAVLAREHVGQHLADPALQVGLVDVGGVEVGTELLDQLGVHDALELVDALLLGGGRPATAHRLRDLGGLAAPRFVAAAVGLGRGGVAALLAVRAGTRSGVGGGTRRTGTVAARWSVAVSPAAVGLSPCAACSA